MRSLCIQVYILHSLIDADIHRNITVERGRFRICRSEWSRDADSFKFVGVSVQYRTERNCLLNLFY